MSSKALDSITIQGFKSIGSVEKLELRPINSVIGSNGSGKSNFLGVFAFLQPFARDGSGIMLPRPTVQKRFCTSARKPRKKCISGFHFMAGRMNMN